MGSFILIICKFKVCFFIEDIIVILLQIFIYFDFIGIISSCLKTNYIIKRYKSHNGGQTHTLYNMHVLLLFNFETK